MAVEAMGTMIGPIVTLMGAAVVAVPLFRWLGLGSVLGYFAAGMLVGPSILGIFSDPAAILHFSELGVVMFLFIIGLELRPQKLWTMRGQIFGLGLAQVFGCIALLTLAAMLCFALTPAQAFVAGAGFVMSSTAVIVAMLQERGEMASDEGQKNVSILLFEDLMIVPLLAIVAFLSPLENGGGGAQAVLVSLGALLLLVLAGRYLLDPFFSLIARARTREVLSAGALLVVLGSALLMEAAGLSMAMGSFIAGVMLSGSSYRHQIESDIEPFRGLLMGLFFLAVGMSLDLGVVLGEWPLLLAMLAVFVIVKALGIYAVARLFGAGRQTALRRTSIFAQGGEFAFVLYAAAAGGGVLSARENAILSTVIILSMALMPLILIVVDRVLTVETSLEGVDPAVGLKGQVLMIGFGRFGQIASQLLLLRGIEVSIIESSPDRIREAERFGFKIYYGDGTRLDILRSSGAGEAEVIMICTDDRRATSHIAELILAEFPMAKVLARSYDRSHTLKLRRMGVDFDIRETVESAYLMGGEGLRALGASEEDIREGMEEIRNRDEERLALQEQGGLLPLNDALDKVLTPEPLSRVRRMIDQRENTD